VTEEFDETEGDVVDDAVAHAEILEETVPDILATLDADALPTRLRSQRMR
jgi:hypothetical protein